MFKQLINNVNGEFKINNDFIVSTKTTLSDLLFHFGKDQLIQSKYVLNCYLTLSQFEIDKLFFKFSFYFENETVKKIGFEIETEPTHRIAWGNNRDFETDWIASQMNDVTKIDWENPACGQYWLTHHWGGVGIFFDFKNGTYDSFLSYKAK